MVSRKRLNRSELDTELVETIERWLASSVPIKEIARRFRAFGQRLSRGTIRTIKRGQHVSQTHGKRFVRHTCGNKVILPCRICEARQRRPAAA